MLLTVRTRTAVAATLALAGATVHSFLAGGVVAEGHGPHQLDLFARLGPRGHLVAGVALAVGAASLLQRWRLGRWLVTAVAVVVLVRAVAFASALVRIDQPGPPPPMPGPVGTAILLVGPLATLLVLHLPPPREWVPWMRWAAAERANWFI